MKTAFLVGRVIFGGYFLYNSFNHFRNSASLAQYAGSKQVPAPQASVLASGALLGLGGLGLVTGYRAHLGAAAILLFLASVSPAMHDFWNAKNPEQRMKDQIDFAKNMALAGAAIALMGVEEPWPASLQLT